MVAQFKNPTVKNDLFSNIGGCQLTARMCSLITFHALKITHSGEFVQHRIFFSGARAPAVRAGLSAAIRGLPRFPPGKAAALPYALFPSAAHLRFNPSRLRLSFRLFGGSAAFRLCGFLFRISGRRRQFGTDKK